MSAANERQVLATTPGPQFHRRSEHVPLASAADVANPGETGAVERRNEPWLLIGRADPWRIDG